MGFVDSLKAVKELEKMLHPPFDTSKVNGTFYYDESNNFRKFRLKETGFNNDIIHQSHFALGGIYIPEGNKPDIDDLLKNLSPQKNQKELKFKFFSYGSKEFIDFLNSKRLKILFDWIQKNDLLIHMSTMDYLYFSIVDIVDDLPDAKETGLFNKPLKDVLYAVVKRNVKLFVDILYRYKYPNLAKETKFKFYEEVYEFYITYYEYDNDNPEDFPKEFLRQMLKSGYKREGMSFLENNEDYVLHDTFETIYVNNPANFPNCKHIFDEETDIMDRLRELQGDYSELLNMKFKKSDTDIFIQLSDAITGFSAKLDNMLFNNDFDEIINFILSLNRFQIDLLYNYLMLVVKSESFCVLFNQAIVPEIFKHKFLILLQGVKMVIKEC